MVNDPLIGKTLANYTVERRLGQGGMAVVYLGHDNQLDRPVAIKLINAQFQGNPAYAVRFVAEARTVARWRHENIISVYYADQDEDLYYFVMEYIDGATLEDLLVRYLQDGELMPHPDVIRIGRAIAGALDYAHKQDVVHRDVKPANVMISRDDRVVLTDFGLALDMSQGSMGQIFGTPHYVAPEQVRRSADALPQSDIYSFGIVLYEMVTGALPFDDPSATALAMQHLTEPPPLPRMLNPELNQQTEDVLLKALAKEPEDRFETATALVDALETALNADDAKDNVKSSIMPPAAITQRETRQPRISHTSISDMLQLELDSKEPTLPETKPPARTRPMAMPPAVTPSQQKTAPARKKQKPTQKSPLKTADRPQTMEVPAVKQSNNMPLIIGGVVIVIAIIAIGAFVMLSGGNPPADEDVTSESVALVETETAIPATDVPQETAIPPTEIVQVEATATEIIQVDATATENEIVPPANPTEDYTATVAAINAVNTEIAITNSFALTATSDALAISNANAEATLTQQAIQVVTQYAVPTEVYPDGRLLELTYNSAGFYLRNSSSSRVQDSRLAFQGINATGAFTTTLFDGVDWARNYYYIDADGRCAAIELTDQSGWTRPTNCVSAAGFDFNSLLSFPTNDDRIFWTGVNGTTHFVVYWDDAELARCDITAGYCQVRVGN